MTRTTSRLHRRAVVGMGAIALCGYLGLQPARTQPKETFLPTPASLREAAAKADRQNEPLVLLASLPGCPWCELLRRNYLAPMRQDGLHAYQINVDDRKTAVADFQNQARHGVALADSLQIKLTPTVLFLSANGTELVTRIEGVASVDLLGTLLDARLQAARTALRAGR
jgi:hypothetical protein